MMNIPGYYEFAMQVYNYLELMQPGTTLFLDKYAGEKLIWIIKTICLFISDSDHWIDYEFNDTYTKVRRRIVAQWEKEWLLGTNKRPIGRKIAKISV